VPPHINPIASPGPVVPPHINPIASPGPVVPPHVHPIAPPGPVAPPHINPIASPGPVVPPHINPIASPGPVVPPHINPIASPGPVVPPHINPIASPGPVVPPHINPIASPGPVVPPHINPIASPGPVVPPHINPISSPGPVVLPHLNPLATPGPVVPPSIDPIASPGPVVPSNGDPVGASGHSTPFAGYASTSNARSAANALDQILARYPTDPATSPLSALTPTQSQLIEGVASLPVAQMPQVLTALDGQVHAAMVAVAPEAGQRMESSVYDHLSDTASEPGAGPFVWGNVSGEFGQRGGDSRAEGFTNNVTQVLVGADLLAHGNVRFGFGYAYTSSNVNESTGNGSIQENAGFVYGQLPVGRFVIDGLGSYGAGSTDTERADPLGGAALQANGVGGGDALVSVRISLPFTIGNVRLAPYARVTWQQVSEDSFSEGTSSAAALNVDRFTGTNVRSMIGITGGSAVTSPFAALMTYRFNLGVGEDAGNLLNPSLHATLAGIGMTIASPQVSSAFGQASVSGTLRLSSSAYLYGQLFGEARGNATLGGITGGVRFQF
jgi:outer membrane autotransporter protein